jgi:hypothetical protein
MILIEVDSTSYPFHDLIFVSQSPSGDLTLLLGKQWPVFVHDHVPFNSEVKPVDPSQISKGVRR